METGDLSAQFASPAIEQFCPLETGLIMTLVADPKPLDQYSEYGSIAVVERLIRSIKNECTRRILVPLSLEGVRSEITLYINWYNQHRPHQALGGRIPMDVYYGIEDDITRLETRGEDANSIRLVVTRLDNRRHLPIVELKRAA